MELQGSKRPELESAKEKKVMLTCLTTGNSFSK